MLRGGGITPCMSRNLIVGAMQAQVQYGLMCTPLSEDNEIQEKYNISNRRALRAILRSPIYGANEATEMELGIKNITAKQTKYTQSNRQNHIVGRDATQQNIQKSSTIRNQDHQILKKTYTTDERNGI